MNPPLRLGLLLLGLRVPLRGALSQETAVLRCGFERCTKAGVSIQNFNSLDWFLRQCRLGVSVCGHR